MIIRLLRRAYALLANADRSDSDQLIIDRDSHVAL